MKDVYRVKALAPIFSYGADPFFTTGKGASKTIHEGTPEIRPASIRGQLRWWMEFLGFSNRIGAIFGSIAGDDTGTASKVVVRVSDIEGQIGIRRSTQQHHWSEKSCYLPGTKFSAHFIERLGGLADTDRKILSDTIEAWLLLGTLGGRGTRAGGSLQDIDQVLTCEGWRKRIPDLLQDSSMRVWLGKTEFARESDGREMICNTLKEEAYRPEIQPLGGIHPRKTSPLRMRIIRFADADPQKPYRIAFVWTGPKLEALENAINTLQKGNRQHEPKPIGDELANAIPIK